MHFPEGLENTPFKLKVLKYPKNCRLHATLIKCLKKILNQLMYIFDVISFVMLTTPKEATVGSLTTPYNFSIFR